MKDSNPTPPPTETPKIEQVLVLPGHLFFIESVEVPADLEVTDIQDFIELNLEGMAPFPVEHLNWGYLYNQDVPSIILYAAHRDRLKNAGYTELESYAWALPDFATLTGACFPEDTHVVLESAESLSLLTFEKGTGIPQSVLVAPINDQSPEEVLKALKASEPNLSKTAVTLRMCNTATELSEQGLPTFRQQASDPAEQDRQYGAWQTLSPTEQQLWQADIRSSDFKTTERSARRTGALLTRITGWAAIFAVVLIGGEFLLGGCKAWLGSLENKREIQRTSVLTIEDKQTLLNKLDQVAQNELRPVDIFTAANNDLRESLNLGIEYDEAFIEGDNIITIDGKASNINAINSYADSLKKSGQFEILTGPEYRTRDGKTTFSVTLSYTHIEPVEIESSIETEPEAVTELTNTEEEAEI